MTDGAKAGAEAVRLANERPERSPRCIEFAWAKRWNGVLPATTVGGGLSPLLSLQ